MDENIIAQFQANDAFAQREKCDRRELNSTIYSSARALAARHGLHLIRHSEFHYSIRKEGEFIINLWPGNQRVKADQNRGAAPFLKLPREWNLLHVVESTIGFLNPDYDPIDITDDVEQLNAILKRIRDK